MQRIRSAGCGSAMLVMVLCLLAPGCKKRAAAVPPVSSDRPRPAPVEVHPSPELEVGVEPDPDGRLWLVWESRQADSLVIDHGIGPVQLQGRLQVPSAGATYTLTALGPGGSTSREVRVAGSIRSPSIPEEAESDRSGERLFELGLRPLLFDLDDVILGEAARRILDENIAWLMRPENQRLRFTIEGHSAPVGSDEFGHALGDLRAAEVMAYMVERGVEPRRMAAVSLGEEEAQASLDEEATGRTGRVVFVLADPDTEE